MSSPRAALAAAVVLIAPSLASAQVAIERAYYENSSILTYGTTQSVTEDPQIDWKEVATVNPTDSAASLGYNYNLGHTYDVAPFTASTSGGLKVDVLGTATNVTAINATYSTGATRLPNAVVNLASGMDDGAEVSAGRYARIGAGGFMGSADNTQFSFTVGGTSPVKLSYSVDLYGANDVDEGGMNVNYVSLLNVNAAENPYVFDFQSATGGAVTGSDIVLSPGEYVLSYVSDSFASMQGATGGPAASVPAGLTMSLSFTTGTVTPPPQTPRQILTSFLTDAIQQLRDADTRAERRTLFFALTLELVDLIRDLRQSGGLSALAAQSIVSQSGWTLAGASAESSLVAGSVVVPEPTSMLAIGAVAPLALRRRARR